MSSSHKVCFSLLFKSITKTLEIPSNRRKSVVFNGDSDYTLYTFSCWPLFVGSSHYVTRVVYIEYSTNPCYVGHFLWARHSVTRVVDIEDSTTTIILATFCGLITLCNPCCIHRIQHQPLLCWPFFVGMSFCNPCCRHRRQHHPHHIVHFWAHDIM